MQGGRFLDFIVQQRPVKPAEARFGAGAIFLIQKSAEPLTQPLTAGAVLFVKCFHANAPGNELAVAGGAVLLVEIIAQAVLDGLGLFKFFLGKGVAFFQAAPPRL